MAGEYIQAQNIGNYWLQLKAYFEAISPYFEEIDESTYSSIERSEREDSDNHLNFQRLGQDTQVVDIAFYKYLPNNKQAFRIHIVNVLGQKEDHYFIINSPKE